jgi:hypothetical protein
MSLLATSMPALCLDRDAVSPADRVQTDLPVAVIIDAYIRCPASARLSSIGCARKVRRGQTHHPRQTAMNVGDRISTFMERIGKGAVNGRVCIVLSDK